MNIRRTCTNTKWQQVCSIFLDSMSGERRHSSCEEGNRACGYSGVVGSCQLSRKPLGKHPTKCKKEFAFDATEGTATNGTRSKERHQRNPPSLSRKRLFDPQLTKKIENTGRHEHATGCPAHWTSGSRVNSKILARRGEKRQKQVKPN